MLYASWVHGHSVQLERPGSPKVTGKNSVKSAFRTLSLDGDIIDLGGYAAVACLRIGWAARFVVFDSGSRNKEKSGTFWCHYAIPTPVIEADARAEAERVLINYESSDINALSICAVHVWDGNKRIFADDSPIMSADDFDGGIPGKTTNASVTPNVSRLLRGDLGRRQVFFGLGVSIKIRAQRAKNDILEIRSVGVDFQLPR